MGTRDSIGQSPESFNIAWLCIAEGVPHKYLQGGVVGKARHLNEIIID